MQWVLFVDIQGFYAGVLRSIHQVPASRPVCVLREGNVWDGCRMALERGLQVGAPARQAARDCPDAVLLSYEAAEYDQAAQAWWNECLRFTPWVEPVAPHRVFLGLPAPAQAAPLRHADAPGMQALPPSVRSEVTALLAEGTARGGVAFAGTAPSRLVARAAAEKARADWFRQKGKGRSRPEELCIAVFPGEEARFLAPLLPGALWPAPAPLLRRIGQLGLRSVGEVAAVSEPELVRQLGPAGRQVGAWARGLDREPVRPLWPPREETERVALGAAAGNSDGLDRALTAMAGRLSRRLAERHEGCLQVTLTLERESEAPLRLERMLQKLQQDAYPLQQALLGLFQRAPAALVTALVAGVAQIGPMPWKQTDLWEGTSERRRVEREQQEQLERALMALHERFPTRVVGKGPRVESHRRESMLKLIDPYRWTAAR